MTPRTSTSIAFALAAALLATGVDAGTAAPLSAHSVTVTSLGADGPTPVRWRGHARGLFEQTVIAGAIANGAMPEPGPLYGRYLGHYGYPGHYPCCYYPQVFDRYYYAYYYIHRAAPANPTWWDYPNHWQGPYW